MLEQWILSKKGAWLTNRTLPLLALFVCLLLISCGPEPAPTSTPLPTATDTPIPPTSTPIPTPIPTPFDAPPSLEELVGKWQTYYLTELVLVIIPDVPAIGKPAATVEYLYRKEAYHCRIDTWYRGFDGTAHSFDPFDDPTVVAVDEARSLPHCTQVGVRPFTGYEIVRENGELTLKQILDRVPQSSLVLRRAE